MEIGQKIIASKGSHARRVTSKSSPMPQQVRVEAQEGFRRVQRSYRSRKRKGMLPTKRQASRIRLGIRKNACRKTKSSERTLRGKKADPQLAKERIWGGGTKTS